MTQNDLADMAYNLTSKLTDLMEAHRDRDNGSGYRQRVAEEFTDELTKLLTKVANFKVQPSL